MWEQNDQTRSLEIGAARRRETQVERVYQHFCTNVRTITDNLIRSIVIPTRRRFRSRKSTISCYLAKLARIPRYAYSVNSNAVQRARTRLRYSAARARVTKERVAGGRILCGNSLHIHRPFFRLIGPISSTVCLIDLRFLR
jgi:hypothetical protein